MELVPLLAVTSVVGIAGFIGEWIHRYPGASARTKWGVACVFVLSLCYTSIVEPSVSDALTWHAGRYCVCA